MSFLDNLENNLKSLESAEQSRDEQERRGKARDAERAQALATAPWAEELKKGSFAAELLKQAARIGFSMRVKVHIAWIGNALRLEARERRLELRPTPTGIVTAYLEGGTEQRVEPLDLKSDPAELVRAWLAA
jgi:hypothetical protein